MNPFTNRWAALFVVVAILLAVSELVGTDEHGGILSRAAQSRAHSNEALPPPPTGPVEIIGPPPAAGPPEVIQDDQPAMTDDSDEIDDTVGDDEAAAAEQADSGVSAEAGQPPVMSASEAAPE